MATYREDDQHNHQSTLGNSVRTLIGALRKEEQGSHAYLLDVESDEQVLKRLGVKQTAGIGSLLVYPEEEVLV